MPAETRGEVPERAAQSHPGAGDREDVPDSSQAAGGYRRIDLNRAGMQELVLLPGIGPKKAEALLRWRAEHGRFATLEDLLEVKGIGESTLERLKPYACLGN